MVEISPAILTDDLEKFQDLLQNYVAAGFKTIDIDIADGVFVPHKTIAVHEVLGKTVEYEGVDFGWHLMLGEPEAEMDKILKFFQDSGKAYRIYVHQEAKLGFLKDVDLFAHHVGITIKDETELREMEFYQRFPEVQLMTVVSGFQGGQFQSNAIAKVEDLRNMGYVGKISLDGGVNLHTAKHIRDYDVNRVSVGSYFQESSHLELDWHKLNLALNL